MPKRNQTKGSTATTKWSDMNIAGSIYFTVAYSPELAAKGLVKLKVGISNCDFKAANTHMLNQVQLTQATTTTS